MQDEFCQKNKDQMTNRGSKIPEYEYPTIFNNFLLSDTFQSPKKIKQASSLVIGTWLNIQQMNKIDK